MSPPVRLWIETTYHPAFRYGGWGLVRGTGEGLSGQAGGERNTTAARIDLQALISGLRDQPAGDVTIQSASPGVIAAARLMAAPPAPSSDAAPAEDLDLWAQALTLARGRSFAFTPAPKAPGGPSAFCFAWAEVGRDKAKGQGRFAAAIPKSNLAKIVLV